MPRTDFSLKLNPLQNHGIIKLQNHGLNDIFERLLHDLDLLDDWKESVKEVSNTTKSSEGLGEAGRE